MKNSQLARLDDKELIERFLIAAKQMGMAVLDSEVRKANRVFQILWDIDLLLRSRGREARLKLLPLLDDKDRFVRYYAAIKLLGLVPDRARAIIEWIHKYWFDALAGDAGMTLHNLDTGVFKPD